MLGILSIASALALLIYFAYRGISVVIIAPIMASLAVLLAGETLILGAYTQVFMKATGNFIILYFPLFLLGAIFGKLMDDSGSADSIAQWAVEKVRPGALDSRGGAVLRPPYLRRRVAVRGGLCHCSHR